MSKRGVTARRLISAAVDLLFPARCAGCGRLGEQWCAQCAGQVAVLAEPLCPKCGYPLLAHGEDCPACPPDGFAFEAARAWGPYAAELRRAILKLKHKQNRPLGAALSRPLVDLVRSLPWQSDGLVSVPLSAGRLAERGYNPVDLLAQPLAVSLGLPLLRTPLQRTRETQPQMALSVRQRWQNVEAAFRAEGSLSGRQLILVDDIMTTGATLHAAAAALLAAGAKRVYALSLARTLQTAANGIW
jgi:ComF family protein